ncbi:MAG: DeoR/GlpR family DNA-binding transcription regulator [Actinomycetes bacterium]
MLAQQRQALILDQLGRSGGVRVSELVQILGVSDMTVRRDLDVLQQRGLLDKVHGGATLRRDGSTDEPGFQAKSVHELAEKDAIGRAAAELVEPGTAIGVTAGTTTYALARHLSQVPGITVVTNSIPVANVFFEAGLGQTVLLTGGLRTVSDALVGPVAVNALTDLHVDVVFMGVHGMEAAAGFTTPNLMEADTNRAMIAAAGRLVVVADHTKWGTVGLSRIARLADASVLVTDSGVAAAAQQALSDQVGRLVVADVATGLRGIS